MKKYTILPLEEKLKAIEMANENNGLKKYEVADLFNVSHASLRNWCRGKGLYRDNLSKSKKDKWQEEVAKLFREGKTLKEIRVFLSSQGVDLRKETVGKWIRETGLDTNLSYSQEFKNRVRERYKEIGSCPQIAKEYHVNWMTVNTWCADLIEEYSCNWPSKRTKDKLKCMIKLREQGLSYAKIAKETETSVGTVMRWIIEYSDEIDHNQTS